MGFNSAFKGLITFICQKYVCGPKVNYSVSNLDLLLKDRVLDN